MKESSSNTVTDLEFVFDMYRCNVNGVGYYGDYLVFSGEILLTCHRSWSYHVPINDSIIESIRFALSLVVSTNN